MHLQHLSSAHRVTRQGLASLGSSTRCRRRNKQSYLCTSDATCTYTICSPSMGSVRFTKTDGSLMTRTAPPWRCPRTLSPTLGSATLWRLSKVVCGFLYPCLWCVPCKWLLLLALYKKIGDEPARRLRATLNPKKVVFGWPWGGLVCNWVACAMMRGGVKEVSIAAPIKAHATTGEHPKP